MSLRRAAKIAACMFAVIAGPAAAQAPWPQPQQQAAPSPWSAQPQQQAAPSPWSAQPQQSQQPPLCIQEFFKLRDAASKRADAIRTASARKVSPQEACGLFNAFSAAEMKMIKYAADNSASCGIPPEVLANLKKGHTKTAEIRTQVGQAAARPAQPAAPSLSDALSAPVPDSKNIKTGRGTFDTLSGTPLGSR
jgi:hypothetical protein